MRPVVVRDLLGQANFGAISGALALPTMLGFAFSPFIGSLLWNSVAMTWRYWWCWRWLQ